MTRRRTTSTTVTGVNPAALAARELPEIPRDDTRDLRPLPEHLIAAAYRDRTASYLSLLGYGSR